jgi:hypothetical protein
LARDVVTVEELQRIANAIQNAATSVAAAVRLMRESDPPNPEILVHAATFMNQTMPRLIDWSVTVQSEARVQTEAFGLGVRSTAFQSKSSNDRRKARESASKQAASAPAKQATKKPR